MCLQNIYNSVNKSRIHVDMCEPFEDCILRCQTGSMPNGCLADKTKHSTSTLTLQLPIGNMSGLLFRAGS
jgi:hypothetical protein